MRDDESLDTILEAALATYAVPERAPDLAARVLASVRQEARPVRHPRRWLIWAIAVPALAALLLAALIPNHHWRKHAASSAENAAIAPQVKQPRLSPKITTPQIARPEAASGQLAAAAVRAPITAAAGRSLPKQGVFPTPIPLTPEEQALVALVNRDPGHIAENIAASQQEPVQPLHIAAIEIPPINPPGKGDN
jgi:hypothetical protein